MSDVSHLQRDALEFLEGYLPRTTANTNEEGTTSQHATQSSSETKKPNGLPFVTLTYAASLDSMIALAPGARTTLSGPESKSMTHYLRLRHDAILVGANTAAVDDPGLNCRYPEATILDQPRPIIVDPNGRWKGMGRKAYRLAAEGEGKAPWVVTTSRTFEKKSRLHDIDGDYVIVDEADPSGAIEWEGILRTLWVRGIKSVMIEGGATVINSLLAQPTLVNAVIITIAPTFLGQGGVAVSPAARTSPDDTQRANAAWLDNTSWKQFGNDVVLCAYLRS
ncbi:Putative bacterial bifunctional deaminase-reductase, dihydrofolate reductase-like domain superfamily [Septoria linicola]|uniref:2,5-diamino-6-ribosylamino-4(3H)-pyrimidinone 5'-phosphate reductase n=1 Tax=Septoria linicola TaxID=215465 RepID=A0A9Q9AH48_9PEZI|nr:putative bacterial bifunctional deaminase-reductase, dihydrofolate reductase-like domain superfamily [Septoria linicola]USW49309.1 Putative bacterial bifunctional deaminase-reductase, dihydrofolate reductase-like domain superfamily [Septoria linicola]